MKKFTLESRVIRWAAIVAALMTIGGGFTYAGFNLEKPWAPRETVETQLKELAGGLTTTIEGQQKLNKKVDRGERRYWVDVEEKAQDDLKLDPNNRSAKRELKRAQDNIRRIDSQ